MIRLFSLSIYHILRPTAFFLSYVALFCCGLSVFSIEPVFAQSEFVIGTKGKYRCSVDSVGIARLIHSKRSGDTIANLKATRRTIRRRIGRLRLQRMGAINDNNLRRVHRISSRRNELKLVLNGVRHCIASNDMTGACTIFEGSESGITRGIYAPRIIDGAACTRGDSPIVLIRMFDDFGDSLGSCSGTVLNAHTVLTAAHCFADNFGNLEASYAEVITGSDTIRSSLLVIHPNYDPFAEPLELNDVAIIRTTELIDTQTLTLWPTNDMVANEILATAGFGLTETGDSDGLRAGFMTIINVTTESIESKYLPGSGSNTCNGDSGGPLTIKRGEQWYLAGVVSNGDNFSCGRNNKSDLSRWANVTSKSNQDFIKHHAPELF